MKNEEKAKQYDEYIRESDMLHRNISKIKSEFVGNIPPDKEKEILNNKKRINELVGKVELLFRS